MVPFGNRWHVPFIIVNINCVLTFVNRFIPLFSMLCGQFIGVFMPSFPSLHYDSPLSPLLWVKIHHHDKNVTPRTVSRELNTGK